MILWFTRWRLRPCDERPQVIIRTLGRRRPLVAVPAQLDAEQPSIPNFGQRRDDRRKIDFALAEHQMLVDSGAHVLDVDVRQPVAPVREFARRSEFSLAMEMADVDREAEPRWRRCRWSASSSSSSS